MRRGLHLLSKADNGFFGNDSVERDTQIAVMGEIGITDVKLVTSSDSQLKAAQYLVQQGFRVIVRFYAPPINLAAVPDDQLIVFRDAGVWAVEGYINEPEIEWNKPNTPDVINDLATAYIRFADACGRVGITPITPAIQGDRVYTWFEPFIKQVIALGRKDTFAKCCIGCHPRPANNLPGTPPPGFVARSYELFDDVCVSLLGKSVPILATEWGYEPGSSENNTLPPIDFTNHATYNVELAQYVWRDSLAACYYWTWLNDWYESGWWRGDVTSSLPVVQAFMDMVKPEPPVDEWTEEAAPAKIREWCWNNIYPTGGIPYNPAAAFQQESPYAPCTVEMHEHGWAAQGFVNKIVYCKEGDWQNIMWLSWSSG